MAITVVILLFYPIGKSTIMLKDIIVFRACNGWNTLHWLIFSKELLAQTDPDQEDKNQRDHNEMNLQTNQNNEP